MNNYLRPPPGSVPVPNDNFLVDQNMEEDIDINGEMDESLFTAEELEEMDYEARLRSLTADKESIKRTSEYFISKVDKSAETSAEQAESTTNNIVKMWARYMIRVSRD